MESSRDDLNHCTLTGALERDPVVSFDPESGLQVCRFTLRVDEQGKGATFKTFIVCEAYGRAAERAAELGAGVVVGIEGKLKWRSTTDRHGEKKSGLCVLVRQVHVLAQAVQEVQA